jgi:hypothetical protein
LPGRPKQFKETGGPGQVSAWAWRGAALDHIQKSP